MTPMRARGAHRATSSDRPPRFALPPATDARLAESVLDSVSYAIIACDDEGTIVESNRSARKLGLPPTGARLDDWADDSDSIVALLTDRDMPLARARAGEEVDRRGLVIRVGGRQRVLDVEARPLRTGDDPPGGALLAVRERAAGAEPDEEVRLHSEIAAHIASGVGLVRTSDGVIVYANDAWERMLAYAPGELIGRHLSEVTTPPDESPVARAQAISRAIERHGAWNGEIRNVRKDGNRFWCAANISTFDHGEYGQTWILVETDISEQKATEESLRVRDERFRRVFEHAPIGIAIIGNDLRIVDANEFLSDLTGYSHDELLGKTLAQMTHPDDVHLDAELSAKAFAGELDRYRVNKRYVSRDGDVIAIALTATYVHDTADRPVHTIAIVEPLWPPAGGAVSALR